MERDLEKDLIEIQSAIKSQEEKDNIFTMSVLQRCYKLVEELKYYKDLDEQRKMVKFPVAPSNIVYKISKTERLVCECVVTGLKSENGNKWMKLCENMNTNDNPIWVDEWYDACKIGKEIFLTREDAEKVLQCIALKPCPFCGGVASISVDPEPIKQEDEKIWAYSVVCDKCAASTGLCCSRKFAIDAWNKRFVESEE